ncbi:hypothetical protein MBLNU230_g1563t1 [Neophaeotheca triangularis]
MSDQAVLRKRSRFDRTTEMEPVQQRGHDSRTRSRSPSRQDNGTVRSRSPIAKSVESPAADGDASKMTPQQRAAAMAAKINADLKSKGLTGHSASPPVQSPLTPSVNNALTTTSNAVATRGESYTEGGDFIRDIEVNDLKNRYLLTKGAFQKQDRTDSFTQDVTTRGNYYPDKSMANLKNPPLHLHVTSKTKEGLEAAIERIEKKIEEALPDLVDQRRFGRQRREPEERKPEQREPPFRRPWANEELPVGLEPQRGFNLRAKIVGPNGENVKYIQTQIGNGRVQVMGHGSGYIDNETGREVDKPMFLNVSAREQEDIAKGIELCKGLLQQVTEEYNNFKNRPAPMQRDSGFRGGRGGGYQNRDRNGSGGYGGGNRGGYGGAQGYDQGYGAQGYGDQAAQSYGGYGAQTAADPNAAAAGGWNSMTTEQLTAWLQYYAANPSQDPYQSVGGFGAMLAAMGLNPAGAQQGGQAGSPVQAEGYAAPAQAQGSGYDYNAMAHAQGAGYGGYGDYGAATGYGDSSQQHQQQYGDVPPPPPPGDDALGAPGSGYNAVPPPPGM